MVVIKDDTNIVNLTGELEDNLEFSHEIFGEKFFNTKIKINILKFIMTDIITMPSNSICIGQKSMLKIY